MIKLIDILNEIGDSSAQKYTWSFKGKYDTGGIINLDYEFKTDNNIRYFVKLTVQESDASALSFEMMVAFGVGRSVIKKALGDKKPFAQIVNKGEVFRVMATVTDIVKDGIKRMAQDGYPVKIILFEAEKEKETKDGYVDTDQRVKLYMAYIKQNMDMVYSVKQKGNTIEVILK
jgi:tRNA threonylcarbamoyladenosine modification (KEOPS) complex Cgi121 subunit